MTIEQTTRPTVRRRVMFGQLLEAGPSGGRECVQVRAGGSRASLALDDALAHGVRDLLGHQVELLVSETLIGETVMDRVISDVRRLDPGERGLDVPTRSIGELAREQGLDQRPAPDYSSILSGLWESEEEAEAFREEIRSGRAAI